jgi:hypothetical protein
MARSTSGQVQGAVAVGRAADTGNRGRPAARGSRHYSRHGRPGPGRHGCAELLRLVDDLRRLAHDRTLDAADRARRIRDSIREYAGEFDDHNDQLGRPEDVL